MNKYDGWQIIADGVAVLILVGAIWLLRQLAGG